MSTKLTILIVILVLVIVFGGWYWYAGMIQNSGDRQMYGSNPEADSTSDISEEYNQIESDASINAELDSLDQEVKGF